MPGIPKLATSEKVTRMHTRGMGRGAGLAAIAALTGVAPMIAACDPIAPYGKALELRRIGRSLVGKPRPTLQFSTIGQTTEVRGCAVGGFSADDDSTIAYLKFGNLKRGLAGCQKTSSSAARQLDSLLDECSKIGCNFSYNILGDLIVHSRNHGEFVFTETPGTS